MIEAAFGQNDLHLLPRDRHGTELAVALHADLVGDREIGLDPLMVEAANDIMIVQGFQPAEEREALSGLSDGRNLVEVPHQQRSGVASQVLLGDLIAGVDHVGRLTEIGGAGPEFVTEQVDPAEEDAEGHGTRGGGEAERDRHASRSRLVSPRGPASRHFSAPTLVASWSTAAITPGKPGL